MFAVGSTSVQVACAQTGIGAATHAHCPGCADHDGDDAAPDTACAARMAAFHHAVTTTISLFEGAVARQLHEIDRGEMPAIRSEGPEPPPPRINERA